MRKGHYIFRHVKGFWVFLIWLGIISLVFSAILFFLGGSTELLHTNLVGNTSFSIWTVFFLLLGIVSFLICFGINKVCEDIAILLKEVEDKNNTNY